MPGRPGGGETCRAASGRWAPVVGCPAVLLGSRPAPGAAVGAVDGGVAGAGGDDGGANGGGPNTGPPAVSGPGRPPSAIWFHATARASAVGRDSGSFARQASMTSHAESGIPSGRAGASSR